MTCSPPSRSAFWLAMTLVLAGESVRRGWLGRRGRAPARRTSPTTWSSAATSLVRPPAGPHPGGRVRGGLDRGRRGGRLRPPVRRGRPDRDRACARRAGWRCTPAGWPTGCACSTSRWSWSPSGELSPVFAGHVYCTLIEGCQEVSDYGRVAEWTAALHAWCAVAARPGAVHRAVRRAPWPDHAGAGSLAEPRSRSSTALSSATCGPKCRRQPASRWPSAATCSG